ncbi:MAG: hypothetical protein GEU88_05280 [Solirubrobacterales bacterium]|nr:hypothetical protein [Solirubrobacterales bacterium]
MRCSLTPRQALVVTQIAAALLEEEPEGAVGEGAYVLELALEEAGCREARAIELEDRDVPWVRAALSAYERRCGGALNDEERETVGALRGQLAGARFARVAALGARAAGRSAHR